MTFAPAVSPTFVATTPSRLKEKLDVLVPLTLTVTSCHSLTLADPALMEKTLFSTVISAGGLIKVTVGRADAAGLLELL